MLVVIPRHDLTEWFIYFCLAKVLVLTFFSFHLRLDTRDMWPVKDFRPPASPIFPIIEHYRYWTDFHESEILIKRLILSVTV